jgi:NAD(P)-dependent dehydrogenase (short-subunit alcohol dehydrogenase family)
MGSSKELRTFENGVAIVTGGASGIGRALAEALAKRGCEVVLADRQVALAREVASRIRATGGRATAIELDVTDFPAVERLVRETIARTGRLDYMFNNAGIGIGGNVSHYGINDWNMILDVNLRGAIHGVQAAYKVMADQGFGHIVNTASMAALMPSPGMAAYSMTKHAVLGLSKALRAEAACLGIRVSVLCPGVIQTPILESGGKYGRMLIDIPTEIQQKMWEKYKPMQPDLFAEQALRALAKNEAIIIIPSWWKMIWRLHRFFPFYGLSLAQKQFEGMAKQMGVLPVKS